MTIEERRQGWLTPLHHARFREVLCHALTRESLVCPAYCLMPDHGHVLMTGLAPASDQRRGIQHLRRAWNQLLLDSGCRLQRQAYDHVLREQERTRGSFATVAAYILENPLRAGLVPARETYPFLGCVVPGYPELDPRRPGFWESFWRIYAAERKRSDQAGA